MYFSGQALAEGANQAGLRCLVTPGVIEDAAFAGAGPWQQQLDEMVATRDRWAGNDLIEVGFGAHAAYSVSRECLSAIADYAANTQMPVHVHLAEQQWEDAAVRKRSAGLRVAIGTDGPASHHRLDLFEEMRTAIRMARIRAADAETFSPAEALHMTTSGAAEVIGQGDVLGRLAPGCWADMVALTADTSALHPVIEEEDDPLSRIVWSGSPSAISAVWVAGRKVVEDGRVLTVDVAEAVAEIDARAWRLAR